MEASAFQAPAGLARTRISIGAPLLRLRSDEQLVALFRAGNEEAFRVIHDRYRQRLFAYTRQMLPGSRPDAEDALQDIFVRAYTGLRATNRNLALRAWLYRVAHNRCVDDLRRPKPQVTEVLDLIRAPDSDPMAEVERRETLKRLIADIGRLPDQQRSALLMRELGGMPYADLAEALGVSVPAIKSLLVRARVNLAQALEARERPCADIREELVIAHDRGVRPSGLARRHLHDCAGCSEFRSQVRAMRRQLAVLVPGIGPLGIVANLLGFGGGTGGAAGGGAAGGGAAAAATGGAGAITSAGLLTGGATHVATFLAAAVVTAGGAVEVGRTIAGGSHTQPAPHRAAVIQRNQPTILSAPVNVIRHDPSPTPAHPSPASSAKPGSTDGKAADKSPSASSTGSGTPTDGGSGSTGTGAKPAGSDPSAPTDETVPPDGLPPGGLGGTGPGSGIPPGTGGSSQGSGGTAPTGLGPVGGLAGQPSGPLKTG